MKKRFVEDSQLVISISKSNDSDGRISMDWQAVSLFQ